MVCQGFYKVAPIVLDLSEDVMKILIYLQKNFLGRVYILRQKFDGAPEV